MHYIEEGMVLGIGTGSTVQQPVSYTHLDVYKRQGREHRFKTAFAGSAISSL